MLYAECLHADCRHTECPYAGCLGAITYRRKKFNSTGPRIILMLSH